ncbi:MAG: cobalt-precorrin 5A hydrolase [Lachnospiraceae bacterium]|nr:cobalt-precorrin 5A hydrolase [Lachnospiraceae bacterium]
MHRIGIAAFTERGKALAAQIGGQLAGTKENGGEAQAACEILWYEKNLKSWCAECFERADGIIFIGACGIAVRTIAPFLKSKTSDPAVLVIDEMGQFVISLLSGHIGGANEFALDVASCIGAAPVITTASDVNGKIAVDVFAKKNHLAIGSMAAAKKIAAAILRGEDVGVYCTGEIEGNIPAELRLLNQKAAGSSWKQPAGKADHILWISEAAPSSRELEQYLKSPEGTVLHLIPRTVVLGIGCRKNKAAEEIFDGISKVLEQERIPVRALKLAASIDLKKEEPGILALCRRYGIDFMTYPAPELAQVQGDFQPSEFVKRTTGVDNVCERAALLAAGKDAKLIRKKYAENGVTAALAVQKWRVRFEE